MSEFPTFQMSEARKKGVKVFLDLVLSGGRDSPDGPTMKGLAKGDDLEAGLPLRIWDGVSEAAG